jgi:hypothetical protein
VLHGGRRGFRRSRLERDTRRCRDSR